VDGGVDHYRKLSNHHRKAIILSPFAVRGLASGANPTERIKLGTEEDLVVDVSGGPFVVSLSNHLCEVQATAKTAARRAVKRDVVLGIRAVHCGRPLRRFYKPEAKRASITVAARVSATPAATVIVLRGLKLSEYPNGSRLLVHQYSNRPEKNPIKASTARLL
jgi:hypothetical protein